MQRKVKFTNSWLVTSKISVTSLLLLQNRVNAVSMQWNTVRLDSSCVCFSCSALDDYRSLTDPHLTGYFSTGRMRRHLRRAGLVSNLLV